MLILAGLNEHDQAKMPLDSKLLASDIKLLCMASEYVVQLINVARHALVH
jgi:hypothetical protein